MKLNKEQLKRIIKEELREGIEDDDFVPGGLGYTYGQAEKIDDEDRLKSAQTNAHNTEAGAMQADKAVSSIYKAVRDDVELLVLNRAMEYKKFISLLGKKPSTRGNIMVLIDKAIESVGQITVGGRNARDFQDLIKLAVKAEIEDFLPSAARSQARIEAAKEIKADEGKRMIAAAVGGLLYPTMRSYAKSNQSFLQKMNPFNETQGDHMKLTKEQLKRIIKEELKLVMQEEDPNYVPLTGSDEENAAKDAANAPHFAGVDAGGEETEGGTLSAQFLAGGDYEPKTPEEEEAQKWHARYAKEQEDPED